MAIASFLIKPDDLHGYNVVIHPTARAMVAAANKYHGKKVGTVKSLRACCLRHVHEVEQDGQWKLTGFLGTIFFTRDDLAPAVVAHELTHAAIGWANRMKLKVQQFADTPECDEERFATALERLVGDFYRQAAAEIARAKDHEACLKNEGAHAHRLSRRKSA